MTNLSVIYLGRRGGGASLVAEFAKFVNKENLSQRIDFLHIGFQRKSELYRKFKTGCHKSSDSTFHQRNLFKNIFKYQVHTLLSGSNQQAFFKSIILNAIAF